MNRLQYMFIWAMHGYLKEYFNDGENTGHMQRQHHRLKNKEEEATFLIQASR